MRGQKINHRADGEQGIGRIAAAYHTIATTFSSMAMGVRRQLSPASRYGNYTPESRFSACALILGNSLRTALHTILSLMLSYEWINRLRMPMIRATSAGRPSGSWVRNWFNASPAIANWRSTTLFVLGSARYAFSVSIPAENEPMAFTASNTSNTGVRDKSVACL